MIERHLTLKTGEGEMNTFVAYPEENGPFPVIFFYMDAPGKREELHDMARRLATVGYFVVLPNLYYRQVPEFEVVLNNEKSRARMFELMKGVSNAMVMRDTRTMLAFVDSEPQARGERIACVGYCMSGPFAVTVAASFPERIAAAACIYGVSLLSDNKDSPHLIADRIKGEMYFACAETDKYAPNEMIKALDAHLAKTGINYRIEVYPGTEHGFAFPQRPAYNKPSAERHWERLFALFARNLH
jgi:carboxymethylenebutenolidase